MSRIFRSCLQHIDDGTHVTFSGDFARVDYLLREKGAPRTLVRDVHDYDGPVFMSHSECLEDVQELAATIEQEYPHIRDGKVQIFPIGATVGVHTGPGTVTLFFWGNPERW